MPLILPSNSISAVGYEVDNSLRFDDGSSDYLSKTFASSGSQQKHTFSVWVKRANLGGGGKSLFGYKVDANNFLDVRFGSSDNLLFRNYNGGSYTWRFDTNRKFRDVSSWYHLVFAVDSTQSTESNRFKLYVNGVQETSFSTATYPSQNANMKWGNNAYAHLVGDTTGGDDFDGYMAEVVVIDNAQLDPTSFGEFDEDTGIWKPKSVSGLTFGTNGFYLDFENSGSLGADVSGNGNNFTVNNLTSIDQSTDTPTNNFATWNPLSNPRIASGTAYLPTFSNGNTTVNQADATYYTNTKSSIGVSAGKWYLEAKCSAVGSEAYIGLAPEDDYDEISATYLYQNNGNFDGSAYGNTYTASDILQIAFDADNGTLWFGKNGTWQNSATQTEIENGTTTNSAITSLDMTKFWHFATKGYNGATFQANFGNPPFTISSGNSDGNGYGNFEYPVPSGYYSLNTKNLSEFG